VVLARRSDGPLVRWGTALHDRFMLPHFVWADFLDVLADLRAPASISIPNGSRRSSSSASPSAAGRGGRGAAGNQPGARTVARAGRNRRDRRHRALCRFLDRAAAGPRHGLVPGAMRRLQRAAGADDPTGVGPGEGVGGVRYKAWAPANRPAPACPSTRR
jgi:hypothetical protein